MLILKAITRDTLEDALDLKVAPNQTKFVAPNADSLAFASFYREYLATDGIFDGDTMLGFTMYTHTPFKGRWIIVRYMIGADFQRKGYGRAGLRALLDYFRAKPGCDGVHLSVVPENTVAKQFYMSMGFRATGKVDEDGEEEYYLSLAQE